MNTGSANVAKAIFLLLLLVVPSTVEGFQDANSTAWRLAATDEGQSASVLSQPARLHIEAAPLPNALSALHSSSGVPVAFSPALIPQDHKVTCFCLEVSVGQAMQTLLEATNLEYVVLAGQLIVREKKRPMFRIPMPSPPIQVVTAPVEATATSQRGLTSEDELEGATARTGVVTGVVRRAQGGAPLQGAQVQIVGTGLGALTNADGRFTIGEVPAGSYQLRVQRIGMRTETLQVTVVSGETASIEIELREEALALDRIVVTGQAGQARQREVGNAISAIDFSERIDTPVSVESALQASAPGLTLMQSSAQIGSGSQIRLRGLGSVSMGNQPLIYIDGVRVRNEGYPENTQRGESSNRTNNDVQSPLNDLNPADIERVEVIKGAAASTLYGTEASAGVIQIFTRQGSTGAAEWTLNVNQGFQELLEFAPGTPEPFHRLEPWLSKGHHQEYNLSVRGGANNVRYFLSGVMDDRRGVLPDDHLERQAIRGNLDVSPFPGLDISWNTSFSTREVQNTPTGNNSHGLTLNVYRHEGNFVGSTDPDVISKVLEGQELIQNIDRFITGLTANFSHGDWSHRLTLGYDLGHQEGRNLRPLGHIRRPDGRLGNRQFRSEIMSSDWSTSRTITISPDLRTTLSVGGQAVAEEEITVDALGTGLLPGLPTVSGAATTIAGEERLRVITGGFFVQGVADIKDRYFVTAGLRVDGNSAFGSGFGLQAYPKVSGSYVVSDEAFWPERWGEFRLRGAFGFAGRAPGAFDAVRTWNPAGWGDRAAFVPLNLGNPELGPERTSEIELGFEHAFLGGRLSTDFTYYRAITEDALFSVTQVPSLGGWSAQLENVGEIRNSGVELSVNGVLMDRPNFSWTLGTDFATNNSEVLDLGPSIPFSIGGQAWVMEGHPVAVLRGVKVLNPDEIADPILDEDHFFGPNSPTKIIGLHTRFELPYGIRVSARGEYQGGHYIHDGGTAGAQSRGINSWPTCIESTALREAGRENELTALKRHRCIAANFQSGSHIYPGDFFKVRDVTVQMPLPWISNAIAARSATLSLSAHNRFRWINREFEIFDPEMMANSGMHSTVRSMNEQVPPPSTITASFRLVF